MTPEEQVIYDELKEDFKTTIKDYDESKNILLGKKEEFTDTEVKRYFERAIKDINKGSPNTRFTIFNLPKENRGLLIDGAVVFTLIGNGILQLRNQISYSDAGLSVGLFDKSSGYQQWAMNLVQMYQMDKREFKAGIIPKSENSGFVGIHSDFYYDMPW